MTSLHVKGVHVELRSSLRSFTQQKPALTWVQLLEWKKLSCSLFIFQVLSYSEGQVHRHGDPGVSARFRFAGNPTQGDASIEVSAVRGSDTGTYRCKVKKAPGVDARKVTLVVLGEGHALQFNIETTKEQKQQQTLLPTVPPSAPECWVDAPEEQGGSVSLGCKSFQGSAPISYRWSRETGGSMPSSATQSTRGK